MEAGERMHAVNVVIRTRCSPRRLMQAGKQ
jgi:hypothetical protein